MCHMGLKVSWRNNNTEREQIHENVLSSHKLYSWIFKLNITRYSKQAEQSDILFTNNISPWYAPLGDQNQIIRSMLPKTSSLITCWGSDFIQVSHPMLVQFSKSVGNPSLLYSGSHPAIIHVDYIPSPICQKERKNSQVEAASFNACRRFHCYFRVQLLQAVPKRGVS